MNAQIETMINSNKSIITEMKDFNAQQAKQIVDSLYTDELHNILVDIKTKAEQGETLLKHYFILGFVTKPQNSPNLQ